MKPREREILSNIAAGRSFYAKWTGKKWSHPQKPTMPLVDRLIKAGYLNGDLSLTPAGREAAHGRA